MTNGLLITIYGKPVVSSGIHEDCTIDDVHVGIVSGSRIGKEEAYRLSYRIGDEDTKVISPVDPTLTFDDIIVQIYKVNCSDGECTKDVISERKWINGRRV